ncbi:MAG: transglycosylase domain-containing protein [Sphingomonas sp.]|uniref:transglycosylase domain-containing protein n=1 Tax=Sphingomonas sp. TaxID=28214 RepID=UPI0035A88A07|nr:transglycosylase domain-containing protein [Sphingomonas sp.]
MNTVMKIGLIVVATLAAALLLFEGYAVWRASARTPAIIAAHRNRPVNLAQVGQRRLQMLLQVEDPGFYRHHGVDFSTPGQGKTTLTQAMVKRLYFDGGFKPGFAKIEQSLIARFVFDPALAKRDQLEIALNIASFGTIKGKPVIGFEQAAQTFFGAPLTRLNDHQFLMLVAMLKAPNALDPIRHPTENADRVARIEALLGGKCKPRDLDDVDYVACAGIK